MLDMDLGSSGTGKSGWDPDDGDLWLEAITLEQGALWHVWYRMEAQPLTLSHQLRPEAARS